MRLDLLEAAREAFDIENMSHFDTEIMNADRLGVTIHAIVASQLERYVHDIHP